MSEGTPEAEDLAEAFRSGEMARIAAALGAAARAKGLSKVAEEAGFSRMGLYRVLNKNSDLRLSSLLGILKAMDCRLTVEHLPQGDDQPAHPEPRD